MVVVVRAGDGLWMKGVIVRVGVGVGFDAVVLGSLPAIFCKMLPRSRLPNAKMRYGQSDVLPLYTVI